MKKTLFTVYYAIIILVLMSQAVYTVYKLGGTVGQGERLKHLQEQQVAMEKDLQKVQEERYSAASLTTLSQATDEYQAIRKPIALSAAESVASR